MRVTPHAWSRPWSLYRDAFGRPNADWNGDFADFADFPLGPGKSRNRHEWHRDASMPSEQIRIISEIAVDIRVRSCRSRRRSDGRAERRRPPVQLAGASLT